MKELLEELLLVCGAVPLASTCLTLIDVNSWYQSLRTEGLLRAEMMLSISGPVNMPSPPSILFDLTSLILPATISLAFLVKLGFLSL